MSVTVWYLSTCSTCLRILSELELNDFNANLIDIKSNPLTNSQIDEMKHKIGTYKALINGRSTQFRSMNKKAGDLSESEAKELLMKHYAFLKRPVIRIDGEYFVGNSKKTVAEVKYKLSNG